DVGFALASVDGDGDMSRQLRPPFTPAGSESEKTKSIPAGPGGRNRRLAAWSAQDARHRRGGLRHGFGQLLVGDDEGRSEHEEVAVGSVGRAGGRIEEQ